jgi:hypothetical protein
VIGGCEGKDADRMSASVRSITQAHAGAKILFIIYLASGPDALI